MTAPPATRKRGSHRGGSAPDDQLHHPPRALRRADPARRQPRHLLPVLHRQHARRHGAHEHRRQARDAGADREVEGRARLRQAAVLERAGAGHREAHRHHLLGALGVAVHAELRPRRQRERGRHRPRGREPHVGQHPARAADLPAAGDREHVVRAAARDVPPHPARPVGRRAVRADAVDLEPVLHHRRPVPVLARAAPGADLGLRERARRRCAS